MITWKCCRLLRNVALGYCPYNMHVTANNSSSMMGVREESRAGLYKVPCVVGV